MGRILDAVYTGANDLAAEGYDLGVIGSYLPGRLLQKAPQVFVIFATPRAVAWAESLGVESAGDPPGTILRRAMVGRLVKQAQRAGLKVTVEWRRGKPIKVRAGIRSGPDARYVVAVIDYAGVSVSFRFFGGGVPEEVGRSWPPAEPVPEAEIKGFLLHAALGVALTLRPVPCAIMDVRIAPPLEGVH
jgi:hypothetical protein